MEIRLWVSPRTQSEVIVGQYDGLPEKPNCSPVPMRSEASAVSFDGSKIVGQYTTSANGIYAFYYSQQHGLVWLGTVSGIATDQSFANGVSSNGMTVGWSGDPFGSGIQAFVWTPKLTIRSLTKYLKNHGAKIASNIYLTTTLDISADGSTIVGVWQDANLHQGGWIAHLN
jgi:uncharacterized membrane protein